MKDHSSLLGWTAAASVLMLVGTAVLMPVLLIQMRPDYFVGDRPPPDRWSRRHGMLGLLLRVVKNIGGFLLLLLGLAMLVLPGQGILTVLMGLALLEFPGKRRVERWIVRRRGVRSGINWIRAKYERPPIVLEGAANHEPRESAGPSGASEARDR